MPIQPTVFGGGGGGSATDHHCGYYYIAPGQTVTVVLYKQMVTFGPFTNDGTLIVDGQHILEPLP